MKHPLLNPRFLLLMLPLLLVACGEGGGSDGIGDGGGGLPTLSIANASVTEGNSGTASLTFTVTLSALANGNVDVTYSTSDGSATAGSDYNAVSNSPLTIPAGSTSATIAITVQGDTDIESNETFTVTLSNPSANAALGSVVATGTILDDDRTITSLNDTGITTCSDETNNDLTCPQATHPGQDAEYGRDAQAAAGTLTKVGGGRAGFDFTKLDSNGNPLANQSADYATTPWDCVRDNSTGLVWEIKTNGGMRGKDHKYTWYNSTGINNGGDAGTANGGSCADSTNCDTEKYVAAVNATGLCGQTDWRLPNVDELLSLVDYRIAYPGPTIDTAYFPNTKGANLYARESWYWSASPYVGFASFARVAAFSNGTDALIGKNNDANIRLVRTMQ